MIAKPAKSLRIVVLVSGRGSNLKAIIDAQNENRIASKIVGVISNCNGVTALDHAKNAKIPYRVVPSAKRTVEDFQNELLAVVLEFNPDLIVLAGFMKVLSKEFVTRFSKRIINIHPSLLPAFPGLNAQEQAIKAGVAETGCTVHFVDEGCDTGPIILQDKEPILPTDTAETLAERLLVKEHRLLIKAIKLLENDYGMNS